MLRRIECLNIKNNAILIADVHYDDDRKDFIDFLDYIENTNPPQVILLGDVFNVLVGGIDASVFANQSLINRLDELGKKIEIIYFEGNHDFNLEKIFKNIKIIKNQPILMTINQKNIAISHGDVFLPFFTQIALRFLRFKFVIFLLNFFNKLIFNKLYQIICNQQKVKKLYKKLDNYKNIVEKRIIRYKDFFSKQCIDIDFIIEGHFHQGFILNDGLVYINLKSFANERSFFILEYHSTLDIKEVKLEERSRNG